MTMTRTAYMPLGTYGEVIADEAILAATGFAAALRCNLHVGAFTVDLPPVYAPLGGALLDIPGLVRAAEEKSSAECERLRGLVETACRAKIELGFKTRKVAMGAEPDAAAAQARYFDLSVLPWANEAYGAQDIAQGVIFGSGRPAVLVPASAKLASLDHLAIAWDGSRVAARALGDALNLLAPGGRVTVLTVTDEKTLQGADIAGALTSSLQARGVNATASNITLGARTIAVALQEAALAAGAQMLAMGGFGHSRLRDFVLGGATKSVLAELRLPVLLAH